MENNVLDSTVETLFPFKFNLKRASGNRLFSEDISNLQTFLIENIRSHNYSGNRSLGMTPEFGRM
jgi:hypothetical protein